MSGEKVMTYEEALAELIKRQKVVDGFPLKVIFVTSLETYDKIIESLEKQMPKKCKKFIDTCTCGHKVYPHMKYCDICGQAIDWSDSK